MQVKRGNEEKSGRKNTKQMPERVSGHMSLWLANLTALRQLSSTDKLCSRCWRSFQLSHQYDWQLRKQADVRTGLVMACILHSCAQTLSLTFYHRRWGTNLVRPLSNLRGEMNVMNVLSKGDLHYVRFFKTTREWRLNTPKQDGVTTCVWNGISERRMHIIAHDLALRIALLAECSPDSESLHYILWENGTYVFRCLN